MLGDHEVELEVTHARHVLRHSFLVVDAPRDLCQFLLEPKVVFQFCAALRLVIRVQNTVDLPLYIVLLLVLLVLDALVPLLVDDRELLQGAELAKVLVRLLFLSDHKVGLPVELFRVLAVEKLAAALDHGDAIDVHQRLLQVDFLELLSVVIQRRLDLARNLPSTGPSLLRRRGTIHTLLGRSFSFGGSWRFLRELTIFGAQRGHRVTRVLRVVGRLQAVRRVEASG